MSEPLTIGLPDGREIGCAEWGDSAGSPVFMLHGTPGCRLNRPPEDGRLRQNRVRLITYDRPGYGASTRHPGRAVVDCVGDVAALADALGVERFAVVGGSGGGPHALALSARLPDRVIRTHCVAEISVPVEVRYGVDDVLVPAAHGAWLAAHIPGADVVVETGKGHISHPDEMIEHLRRLAHG